MKKIHFLLSLALAFSLTLPVCAQSKRSGASGQDNSDLAAIALKLCDYIPDHGLRQDARDYLTPAYFRAYSEAFDAPDGAYGEIGESEWLYYFVTGNGGSFPYFSVQSLTRTDQTHAVADITIQDIWVEGGKPDPEKRAHRISMVLMDGRWRLDDFDKTKQGCRDYVRMMRAQYKSGEIVRYLQSQDYSRPYIPDFLESVEEFYRKYGKDERSDRLRRLGF